MPQKTQHIALDGGMKAYVYHDERTNLVVWAAGRTGFEEGMMDIAGGRQMSAEQAADANSQPVDVVYEDVYRRADMRKFISICR